MSIRKPFSKIMAGILAFAMIFSIVPITVGAEDDPPAPVSITGFDPEPYHQPDDPGATHIAVDFGTPEGDIPLPMALNATIKGALSVGIVCYIGLPETYRLRVKLYTQTAFVRSADNEAEEAIL